MEIENEWMNGGRRFNYVERVFIIYTYTLDKAWPAASGRHFSHLRLGSNNII